MKGERLDEHHLSFEDLESLMPASGTAQAKAMAHLLTCDLCAGGALALLRFTPPSGKPGDYEYGEVFNRVESGTRRLLLFLAARYAQAARLVDEISLLPESERAGAIRTHAQARPLETITGLLDVAKEEARTEPGRAAELARWAALAAEGAALPERASLLVQAHCLLADSYRRGGNPAGAEEAFVAVAANLSGAPDLRLHALYCHLLSSLRKEQGRIDEAVALLHRARVLFDAVGDAIEAEELRREIEKVDPLGWTGAGSDQQGAQGAKS